MNPRFTALCTIVLALLATPASVNAETITAAYGDWPPFFDTEKSSGVALEITQAAMASQGYTLELIVAPWARVNVGVNKQQYDITLGAWWTEERSAYYQYSEPYLENAIKFIKLKGNDFEYTSLASLNGKQIGTVRGYGYSDDFLNSNEFRRQEANDLVSNIRKLINQRIDLTLEDEIVARATIAKEAPELASQITFTSNALTVNRLHVAGSKDNAQALKAIEAFNLGLAEIKANGTFDAILARYELK